MSKIQKTLGNNIRRLRNSKNWTQLYLADRIEITPSFLTMIESGQRGVSLNLIEKISNVFEVPIAVLFLDLNTTTEKSEKLAYLRNIELDMLQKKLNSQISEFITKSIEELKK